MTGRMTHPHETIRGVSENDFRRVFSPAATKPLQDHASAGRPTSEPRRAVTRPDSARYRPWPFHCGRTPGADRPGKPGRNRAAAAALVWSVDLPRPLQQILVDTAYDLVSPALSGVG